jgi:hypothetical protein
MDWGNSTGDHGYHCPARYPGSVIISPNKDTTLHEELTRSTGWEGRVMNNRRERQQVIHPLNPSICPAGPNLFFGGVNRRVLDQYRSGVVEMPGIRMIRSAPFSSYQTTMGIRK